MSFVEETVRTTFDRLVARQVILYGPETVEYAQDGSFNFEFRICPAIASKPSHPGAKKDDSFDRLPKFGPGSDLVSADPDLIVTEVCGTHLLVFNSFCVFRTQYLILTLDSFKRQTENLDRTDIAAAWDILQRLSTKHFIMYNCGPKAGCSRLHKHMQVIPCSEKHSLFPDHANVDPQSIPFKYYIKSLDDQSAKTPEHLYEIYYGLCEEAQRECQASPSDTSDHFPHNVVLTKDWITVIPRSRAETHGASANAAGMMGMVWVTKKEQLHCWKVYGPAKVLSELGVASVPR